MHRHDGSGSGREISLHYYAGRVLWTALRWYFLITIAFVILYPLMYMVSMAFRSPQDFYDVTVVWIPKHLTLDNFRRVLFGMGLLRPLLNTAFTSVCATVLHILVVAATGYGFARYAFSGRGAMFVLAVSTIMIPAQMLNLPNYLVMKELDFFGIVRALTGHASPVNLLNSPLAVLMPAALGQGLMSGFFILVFRQFFANLPNELEEAATIDGCGHLRTYFSVMLPNAATALTICSIFSLTWYWTDYQGPFVFFTTFRTLAVELMNFDQYAAKVLDVAERSPYYVMPMQQAACIVALLPLLIVFLVSQRSFARGVERSGIVG